MKALETLKKIKGIQTLIEKGAEIFLVGGIVRDHFLNKKSKDIDIVVRLMEENDLITILNRHGKVDKVGESFGVIKFHPNDIKLDEPIDIAFPRFDRKATPEEEQEQIKEFGKVVGRGIITDSDVMLPIEEDLERRDISINSIAMNLKGDIIDPFNGMKDLDKGIIRATSDKAFIEDPLRMMRVLQFSSRFDFEIERNTWLMIQNNVKDILTISGERVLEELDKIFFKGNITLGLQLFSDSGLHNQLFECSVTRKFMLDNSNLIKSREDFFFLVCGFLEMEENFKHILKGDTDTFKGMEAIKKVFMNKDSMSMKKFPSVSLKRGLIFDTIKTSKRIFNSGLVSEPLQVVLKEFDSGIMPCSIKDLDINGHDLMKEGFTGKDIGDRFDFLLTEIFSEKRKNVKTELLKQ